MAAILNSAFLDSAILPKKLWLKLIQFDSNTFILTQLDDGSHLEFYHVGFHHLYSAILVFPLKLTHTFQDWFPPFAQKKTSLTLPSLPFGKKNFTHWFWLSFMMAAILNSAFLDSAILPKTLTQTNSIWLKHIYSDSTWWWQPSWTLSCWIQRPCFLLSDSLKNTLTPLWLWLN